MPQNMLAWPPQSFAHYLAERRCLLSGALSTTWPFATAVFPGGPDPCCRGPSPDFLMMRWCLRCRLRPWNDSASGPRPDHFVCTAWWAAVWGRRAPVPLCELRKRMIMTHSRSPCLADHPQPSWCSPPARGDGPSLSVLEKAVLEAQPQVPHAPARGRSRYGATVAKAEALELMVIRRGCGSEQTSAVSLPVWMAAACVVFSRASGRLLPKCPR